MNIVEIKDIGKKYVIRHDDNNLKSKYKSIGESISLAGKRIYNKLRYPTLTVNKNSSLEEVWAIKDINLNIKEGEKIGIIGRNGAGKSTLLKVLSRITHPTTGRCVINGRVSSLLEVGTGFHPELTGRENIFLNGTVLGMTRKEIKNKFEEIVEFSGVEKFLDTPVKRYSSGMYVRLAFSVAAHLEPEILLIDEVLAVGDVEFQKKCLGKMDDVSRHGRTVIFVSHNMSAIRSLCDRVVLMESGRIAMDGAVDEVVTEYLDKNLSSKPIVKKDDLRGKIEEGGNYDGKKGAIEVEEISVCDENGCPTDTFHSDEVININVKYRCSVKMDNIGVAVHIVNMEGLPIMTSMNRDDEKESRIVWQKEGLYSAICRFEPNMFGENEYHVSVDVQHLKYYKLKMEKILKFKVLFSGYNDIQENNFRNSFTRPLLKWKTDKI